MNRSFKIATLSANHRSRLADPITILTAGLNLAQTLFPNIFGSNRRKLTMSDWDKLFPGNGYWTVMLKTYLSGIIKYDVDLRFLYPFRHLQENRQKRGFIADFVAQHENQICPGSGGRPCWFPDMHNELVCQPCMNAFAQILKSEQTGGVGGGGGTGTFPGYPGGIKTEQLLLIGGSALLLIMLLNKKGKRK